VTDPVSGEVVLKLAVPKRAKKKAKKSKKARRKKRL
jgi:hypothetical protein